MARPDEDFEPFMAVPPHLCERPPIADRLPTETSHIQERTIKECLPFLTAVNDPSSNPFDFDEHGVRFLQRQTHVDFVHNGLEPLPAQFVAIDASRPWLMYWSLLSLYIMGEDVTTFRSSILETFRPLQNVSGGFGGGQGHLSHLAGTYAVILALAMVGGDEAYAIVDRVAMWRWLGQLKQADGGFRVCDDGEEDVRGAYCALVAITLLGLPWQMPDDSPTRAQGLTDFRDGLGEYLSRCQTYEGGISAGPSNEAHGAYTFCALACLCILGKPRDTITRYLNVEALTLWLSARQYAPEGGLAGRTNKVVDGCYSHWIGGCWPLIEAALQGSIESSLSSSQILSRRLFSDEGLTRYILGCCQAPSGGLRDKPSKRPDAYHTCYNLAGLSICKHWHEYSDVPDPASNLISWTVRLNDGFRSTAEERAASESEVATFHPVYVIPYVAVKRISQWSKLHHIVFSS